MLTLTTSRPLIRPFTLDDLPAFHQMLDQASARIDPDSYGALRLEERTAWLRWNDVTPRSSRDQDWGSHASSAVRYR